MSDIKERFFLSAEKSLLVVVDVQERLCMAMDKSVLARLTANIRVLLEAAAELSVPVAVTEQYVKGLGATVPELAERLGAVVRHEKMAFSCCGCEEFMAQVRASGRRQIVVVGTESHVCVLQTVLELLEEGYAVQVVQDAVMSRSKQSWRIALEIMQQAGAVVTCTESVLFQWLRVAGTEPFRKLSKLIK